MRTRKRDVPPLAVVIPVRNEADNIGVTLTALRDRISTRHSVYIIDDSTNPSDKTIRVVRAYARTRQNIYIVRKHPEDMSGFAAALKRGVQAVKEKYVVFVMADLCD